MAHDESSNVSCETLDSRAPKSKRDYFALGHDRGLPNRCPILRRCERHSYTVYLGNLAKGPIPPALNPVVPMIEEATLISGNTAFFLRNLCPEVALFEGLDCMSVLSGCPTTSGDYDEYRNPEYRILDTGHFSECAEYAEYINSCTGLSSRQANKESALPANDGEYTAPEEIMMAIERIAKKFGEVVARLSSRRSGREPLSIADEYDVEYLFEALLSVEFSDIRSQETGPSVAGGSMRVDCLLKKEQTFIEFKMTRPGLTATALRKELADDFVLYADKCKRLFVFVYDPKGFIKNRSGVEADLSRPRPPIEIVRTFIFQ